MRIVLLKEFENYFDFGDNDAQLWCKELKKI
jgi:hypothetical protein